MLEPVVTGLLWFCAVGCGLPAGVYFAFSTFIMTALARLDTAQGIAAMNAINSTILGSLFMPAFFGTTLASAALAVLALARLGDAGAAAMLAGGLVYVASIVAAALFIAVIAAR